MKMQRYRRRTVKMSLSKINSSLPHKRQHVVNAHQGLEHFYLSKSQIYGTDNSKTLTNQREQSSSSVNDVINKLQETKMLGDWFRETKVLKKR